MQFLELFRAKTSAKAWTRFALQPIKDMGKDYVDTFKVYRSGFSGWHFTRDFLQPVFGILYLGSALLLAASPVFLLFRFFVNTFTPDTFKQNMLRDLKITGIALLGALTTAIRGITMLATFPLTYLFKIPIRSFLTYDAMKNDELPLIEESKGFKRDMEILRRAIQNTTHLNPNTALKSQATVAIMTKFRYALKKGVATKINPEKVEEAFKRVGQEKGKTTFDEACKETYYDAINLDISLNDLFNVHKLANGRAITETTEVHNSLQTVNTKQAWTIKNGVIKVTSFLDHQFGMSTTPRSPDDARTKAGDAARKRAAARKTN